VEVVITVNRDLFITGTDTGVGKTLLSALLVAALGRHYWKPVQTGACEGSDREAVMRWAGITADETYAESYVFDAPVSPHLAAKQEGIIIDVSRIQRPLSSVPLIIEGAGGVFVPINDGAFMLDLMRHLDVRVIVAARTGLGTINHTLLTLAAIRHAMLDLCGLVMIGKENPDNRRAVEHYGHVPVIGSIPWLNAIDRQGLLSVFEHTFDSRVFI
jgi:dethiobiotin synthase